jgi:hypothetical protein
VIYQSQMINFSELAIQSNPFAEISQLSSSEYRIYVSSLYYAPSSMMISVGDTVSGFIGIHSISTAPVVSLLPPDPLVPGIGFTAFGWNEIFSTTENFSDLVANGRLNFSFIDSGSNLQTQKFYSVIPEPSVPVLLLPVIIIVLCCHSRKKKPKFNRENG